MWYMEIGVSAGQDCLVEETRTPQTGHSHRHSAHGCITPGARRSGAQWFVQPHPYSRSAQPQPTGSLITGGTRVTAHRTLRGSSAPPPCCGTCRCCRGSPSRSRLLISLSAAQRARTSDRHRHRAVDAVVTSESLRSQQTAPTTPISLSASRTGSSHGPSTRAASYLVLVSAHSVRLAAAARWRLGRSLLRPALAPGGGRRA